MRLGMGRRLPGSLSTGAGHGVSCLFSHEHGVYVLTCQHPLVDSHKKELIWLPQKHGFPRAWLQRLQAVGKSSKDLKLHLP